MTPEISVLLPVYNAEKCLSRCLKSLSAQTFQNFEIVCLNDGSTDQSERCLNEAALRDNRLRVIAQPNSGVAAARNRLLQEAHGKYIAFVDADDWIMPGYLERLYGLAERTEADVTRCAYKRYSERLHCWKAPAEPSRRARVPANPAGRLESAWKDSVVWGKLYRRDFLEREKLRFLAGYAAEDFGFCMLSFALANCVETLNEELYVYCIEVSGSVTSDGIRQKLGSLHNALYASEELSHRGKVFGKAAVQMARYVLWCAARLRKIPADKQEECRKGLERVRPCLVGLLSCASGLGRLRIAAFLRLGGSPGTKCFYRWAHWLR